MADRPAERGPSGTGPDTGDCADFKPHTGHKVFRNGSWRDCPGIPAPRVTEAAPAPDEECRYCGMDADGLDAMGRPACEAHIEEVAEDLGIDADPPVAVPGPASAQGWSNVPAKPRDEQSFVPGPASVSPADPRKERSDAMRMRGTPAGAPTVRRLLDELALAAPDDDAGFALYEWAAEVTRLVEGLR